MKKLLIALAVASLPVFAAASAHAAASAVSQVQSVVKSCNNAQDADLEQKHLRASNDCDLGAINVIAAKNPDDQGDIALYLLQQSQNTALNQSLRVKLFEASAPFGNQIPAEDANQARGLIANMLDVSGNPTFLQDHGQEAAGIIAAALSLSDQPNILSSDENLHNEALAQANDLPPGDKDSALNDQVDLALQIGLSPPLGPRGIINPSQE